MNPRELREGPCEFRLPQIQERWIARELERKDKVEIVAISGRFLASKPLVGLRESEDVLSENLRLRSGRQNLAQPQDVILKKYLNG